MASWGSVPVLQKKKKNSHEVRSGQVKLGWNETIFLSLIIFNYYDWIDYLDFVSSLIFNNINRY